MMVKITVNRLVELKEQLESTTQFEDHAAVFSDEAALGKIEIIVHEDGRKSFMSGVDCTYVQSVIYNITSRLNSSDVYSAFSIFNPTLLPKAENLLPSHGEEKLRTLINIYGIPQQVTFEVQTRFLYWT